MLASNRVILLAAGAAATAGLVMLRIYDPATSGVFPPCPVFYLTGSYCPGCGSLRALHQLLHGNLRAAWAMNPLMILCLPFVAYGVTSHVLLVFRGHGLPQVFLPERWIHALGILIVAYGIVRNLPVYPLNLLAPGAMLHF